MVEAGGVSAQLEPGILFETDEHLAERIRAVAAALRVVASRRRCMELAGELEGIARILDPAGAGAA